MSFSPVSIVTNELSVSALFAIIAKIPVALGGCSAQGFFYSNYTLQGRQPKTTRETQPQPAKLNHSPRDLIVQSRKSIVPDTFEASMLDTAGALAEKVGKGALLDDWVVQLGRARRILLAIAKNVYADNVEKMAAWTTASHLERAPRTQTPTPPTP